MEQHGCGSALHKPQMRAFAGSRQPTSPQAGGGGGAAAQAAQHWSRPHLLLPSAMLPATKTPRVALHGLGLLAATLATACMFALPPCASGPKERATRRSGLYARPAGLVGAAEQGECGQRRRGAGGSSSCLDVFAVIQHTCNMRPMGGLWCVVTGAAGATLPPPGGGRLPTPNTATARMICSLHWPSRSCSDQQQPKSGKPTLGWQRDAARLAAAGVRITALQWRQSIRWRGQAKTKGSVKRVKSGEHCPIKDAKS